MPETTRFPLRLQHIMVNHLGMFWTRMAMPMSIGNPLDCALQSLVSSKMSEVRNILHLQNTTGPIKPCVWLARKSHNFNFQPTRKRLKPSSQLTFPPTFLSMHGSNNHFLTF